MIEPRILFSDDDHVLAAVDVLVVFIATRPASADHVRLIDEALRDLVVAHPEGVAYLHVVDGREGETRQLPDAARRAFMELARNAPREARAAGIALLAEGFVAAAMRGIVAGALRAFRTPLPMKVFGNVDDTCRWVELSLRSAGARIAPAEELARAVHLARAAVPSRRS